MSRSIVLEIGTLRQPLQREHFVNQHVAATAGVNTICVLVGAGGGCRPVSAFVEISAIETIAAVHNAPMVSDLTMESSQTRTVPIKYVVSGFPHRARGRQPDHDGPPQGGHHARERLDWADSNSGRGWKLFWQRFTISSREDSRCSR